MADVLFEKMELTNNVSRATIVDAVYRRFLDGAGTDPKDAPEVALVDAKKGYDVGEPKGHPHKAARKSLVGGDYCIEEPSTKEVNIRSLRLTMTVDPTSGADEKSGLLRYPEDDKKAGFLKVVSVTYKGLGDKSYKVSVKYTYVDDKGNAQTMTTNMELK